MKKLNEMTKREVKKLAKQKISEGKSQQETYDEIVEMTKLNRQKVAQIVKMIPTIKSKAESKLLNSILVVLLVLKSIMQLVLGFIIVAAYDSEFAPVVFILSIPSLLLMIGVATYFTDAHRITGILAFGAFLFSILTMGNGGFDILVFLDIVLLGSIFIISLYLQAVLVPGYKVVKEDYTDEESKSTHLFKVEFKE